jgi:acetolactate synthase-1/3 small subunit
VPTSYHTIAVFVENRPGVLMRVASLFSRRGFNIESLTVGPTERPEYSRMTIVVRLDSKPVDQVIRQVHKLVPVVEVRELSSDERVDRELMMIKISAPPSKRGELRELAEIFRARIVDVSADSLMIEATGTPDKLDGLEANLRPYGIQELCRTGRISLERGTKTLPPQPGPETAMGTKTEEKEGKE